MSRGFSGGKQMIKAANAKSRGRSKSIEINTRKSIDIIRRLLSIYVEKLIEIEVVEKIIYRLLSIKKWITIDSNRQ